VGKSRCQVSGVRFQGQKQDSGFRKGKDPAPLCLRGEKGNSFTASCAVGHPALRDH
jgi:hypothetical protein